MNLLVLGAGAVGGYYGGRLAEAGVDVTFLVRPGRRAQLAREGLRIESPRGDLRRAVQTVEAHELRPGYDAILLTCKAYDLDSAMEAIAPAVTDRCVVVPVLNGMSHLERLDARFGRDRVMGGSVALNVVLREDGTIVHMGNLQRIVFGERDGTATARATALADAFAATSLEWELSPQIMLELWEKLVYLSTLAALTSLFRGNVAEIHAAPGGGAAIERALAAAIEVATREGFPPREAVIARARGNLFDPAGHWDASLHRDMEAGKPVESDHIVGWMLERARRHGVDDLLLSLAYTHLRTYEARRAAGRLP